MVSPVDQSLHLKRVTKDIKRMKKTNPALWAAIGRISEKYVDSINPDDPTALMKVIKRHFDEDLALELKKTGISDLF